MRRPARLAVALTAGLAAQAAVAQDGGVDMVPIAQAVTADPGMALARCAAFYVAGADLLQAQMTEDLRVQVNMIVGSLMMRGVQQGQEDGLSVNAAREAMTARMAPHVPAYRERFAANLARDGRAFAGDPVWEADSAYCEALVREGAVDGADGAVAD